MAKNNETDKLQGYLEDIDQEDKIEKDEDLDSSDRISMASHNRQYDRLLKVYVDKTEKTFKFKLLFSKIFLCTSLGILIAIMRLLWKTITYAIESGMEVEKLSILVPISVSFLTVYIVIPQIITKYLFNEKEEEYTANVIGNIQEFDKEVRKNLIETRGWKKR